MRAKVTVSVLGEVTRNPGDVVEGTEARSLVEAGFAVPMVELRKVEKAVSRRPAKEERYFDLRKD